MCVCVWGGGVFLAKAGGWGLHGRHDPVQISAEFHADMSVLILIPRC